MVSFLRDVMIVVAIVASLVAWAFYPSQDTAHANAHSSIPVGVAPAPVASTAGVDATGSTFEKRP